MVSDGTAKPVRWRIRPPSFVNLSAIPKMVEGHLLSDVIAINASIDIVMGEIDRGRKGEGGRGKRGARQRAPTRLNTFEHPLSGVLLTERALKPIPATAITNTAHIS